MYEEQDYIQVAKDGFGFGHKSWKYRVMDRQKITATHHTDDLENAKRWFRKCRAYWLEQEALERGLNV